MQEPRPGEAIAVIARLYAACSSGETATSWRSAFWTIGGYCLRSVAPSRRRAPGAPCRSAPASPGRAGGCARTATRPRGASSHRRLVRVPGIERLSVEHVLRDPPAPAPGRGVEPARVVPARDVRRIEQLLARDRAEPRPGGRVDPASNSPQQPGVVDDRRLHHPRALVEGGWRRIASTTGRTSCSRRGRAARAPTGSRASGASGTK